MDFKQEESRGEGASGRGNRLSSTVVEKAFSPWKRVGLIQKEMQFEGWSGFGVVVFGAQLTRCAHPKAARSQGRFQKRESGYKYLLNATLHGLFKTPGAQQRTKLTEAPLARNVYCNAERGDDRSRRQPQGCSGAECLEQSSSTCKRCWEGGRGAWGTKGQRWSPRNEELRGGEDARRKKRTGHAESVATVRNQE